MDAKPLSCAPHAPCPDALVSEVLTTRVVYDGLTTDTCVERQGAFSETDFALGAVPRRGCGHRSARQTASNLTNILQGGPDETV